MRSTAGKDELLRRVQDAELRLLNAFDGVCRAAGVRYFPDSGTLLGAVRHGGFIPRDDDADVILFRSDYEKLRDFLLDHGTSDGFEFCDCAGRNGFFYDFIPRLALRDSRLHAETPADRQYGSRQNRLGLDLFIPDGAPERAWKIHLELFLLRAACLLAMGRRGIWRPAVNFPVVGIRNGRWKTPSLEGNLRFPEGSAALFCAGGEGEAHLRESSAPGSERRLPKVLVRIRRASFRGPSLSRSARIRRTPFRVLRRLQDSSASGDAESRTHRPGRNGSGMRRGE